MAAPSSLIGASNFLELAVATTISLFGFQSGAALATVVGVPIEVPVIPMVVRMVNRSQHWYKARANGGSQDDLTIGHNPPCGASLTDDELVDTMQSLAAEHQGLRAT